MVLAFPPRAEPFNPDVGNRVCPFDLTGARAIVAAISASNSTNGNNGYSVPNLKIVTL